MKLCLKNKKKLNAVKKSLLLGVPIAGMMLAGCSVAPVDKGISKENDPVKRNIPVKKTFSINPMSLFDWQSTTGGVICPPSIKIDAKRYKVQPGDTWESLAARHGITVEIMLRINGIPAEKAWDIIASKKIPDNLKLVPGQEIYVPGK